LLIYFKYLFSIFYSHIPFWGVFFIVFPFKTNCNIMLFHKYKFLLLILYFLWRFLSIFRTFPFLNSTRCLIFHIFFYHFCQIILFKNSFLPQFDLWLSLKIYSCVYIYILIDIIYMVFHMPQLELPQSCIIHFNVFSCYYVTLNSYGCLRIRFTYTFTLRYA